MFDFELSVGDKNSGYMYKNLKNDSIKCLKNFDRKLTENGAD